MSSKVNAFQLMMNRAHQKPVYKSHDVTLAHNYDKDKYNVNGWWWSEKLDGVRALWNGKDLVTRNGKRLNCHQMWTRSLPIDIALDGELFYDRGKFNHVVSVVRRNTPTHHWMEISYAVFDSPTIPGTYRERYETLKNLKARGELPGFVHVMEQHEITRYVDLGDKLKEILSVGGEGLMLRNPEMPYENGRSHNLLKIKGVEDYDAVVTDILPGEGKHEGRMGAIQCRMDNGVVFKIGTGFTDDQRQGDAMPSVGERVRYRCMEFTPSGVPRFPVFVSVRD